MTQLTLPLPTQNTANPPTEDIAPMSDQAWEHCLWLRGILQELPVSFVFTDDCHVIEVEDGVYCALGADPHQWQEFIWLGDDEWVLGDSDIGLNGQARIDSTEFAFILGALKRKEPMPSEKIKAMRVWL